jgi:hypothetical protein
MAPDLQARFFRPTLALAKEFGGNRAHRTDAGQPPDGCKRLAQSIGHVRARAGADSE